MESISVYCNCLFFMLFWMNEWTPHLHLFEKESSLINRLGTIANRLVEQVNDENEWVSEFVFVDAWHGDSLFPWQADEQYVLSDWMPSAFFHQHAITSVKICCLRSVAVCQLWPNGMVWQVAAHYAYRIHTNTARHWICDDFIMADSRPYPIIPADLPQHIQP